MTELLASILSLIQNQTVLQLESIRPGEHTDCTLLTILRSLSFEQLEELRPDLVLHRDCDSTHCKRSTLAPLGNDVTPDSFSLSESIMNTEEIEREEMDTTSAISDTTSVPEDTASDFGETSGILEDTSGVLDDTTGTVEDTQLDELICHISDTDLLQDTPPAPPLVSQPYQHAGRA